MGRLLLIVCLFMGGCGGCGDDSKVGRLPDAPPPPDGAPDAMTDAMIDAPAPLTVKLTITRNGAPATMVQVYFQNADNSLVKSVKTDGDGEAEAVMEAGGFVTAIDPFTTAVPAVLGLPTFDNELRTFAGVKPGDHLFLTFNDTPESTTVDVTLPDADTDFYEINTTCGSGDAPVILPGLALAVAGEVVLASDCTAADFLVLALNENKGPPIPVTGFSHNDVDVTQAIDFTTDPADEYTDLAEVTYSYSNIPDDESDLSAAHYRTSKNDKMFVSPYGGRIRGIAEGSAENVFPEPALPDAHLGILLSTLSRSASHALLTWGANAARYDVDLAKLLPDIIDRPSYQISTQQLQWEEDAGGAAPDLTVAAISVQRAGDPSRSWRWMIAAPHTADRLQMPTVPDDVDDFMPRDGDNVAVADFFNAKVTLMSPAAAGYDAVRAHILEGEERAIATLRSFDPLRNRTVFVTGAQGEVALVGLPPSRDAVALARADRASRTTGMVTSVRTSWLTATAKASRGPSKAVKAKAAPASVK